MVSKWYWAKLILTDIFVIRYPLGNIFLAMYYMQSRNIASAYIIVRYRKWVIKK